MKIRHGHVPWPVFAHKIFDAAPLEPELKPTSPPHKVRVSITLATTQTRGLYRRWGIKTAREYARIKIDGLRLVCGNPGFPHAPGHGDDDARFYDRQQAYVHARGG